MLYPQCTRPKGAEPMIAFLHLQGIYYLGVCVGAVAGVLIGLAIGRARR